MLAKIDLCKKIKNDISHLNQNELEEVFKIIYNTNNNYSKNNSGVLINLTWLNESILEQINNYIDFCIKSHNEITKYENICNSYIDVFNKEKVEDFPVENTDLSNKNKQKISSYMKFYLLKKKFTKNLNVTNNKIDKYLTHEEYVLT
jgi:hypothetical protein